MYANKVDVPPPHPPIVLMLCYTILYYFVMQLIKTNMRQQRDCSWAFSSAVKLKMGT